MRKMLARVMAERDGLQDALTTETRNANTYARERQTFPSCLLRFGTNFGANGGSVPLRTIDSDGGVCAR